MVDLDLDVLRIPIGMSLLLGPVIFFAFAVEWLRGAILGDDAPDPRDYE